MSLIESCKRGDLEGVKAALESGADVNSMDEDGYTGLMMAISFNHNAVVALLLKTPNIDVNQKNDRGNSALHVAMESENNEALKLLLNVPNIDVNNNGYNALHLAVLDFWGIGNIEGLKLLLTVPNIDMNIVT